MQEIHLDSLFKGKYEFVKSIGSGSFAHVVLVKDPKTQQLYACKIVKRSFLLENKLFRMFEQEVRLMESFDHPNIVKIHDVVFSNDFIFLVMEYCSNGELYSYIASNCFLNEREVIRLTRQILLALSYLHKKKIAHRDIKPENILLDDSRNAKIADFGICRQCKDDELMKTQCGSIFYVAPEILQNLPYDGLKADIWSLGVVVYSMTTGKLPWTEVNHTLLVNQILNKEILYPKCMNIDLKNLIKAMLNRDTQTRATADELLLFPVLKPEPEPEVVKKPKVSSSISAPRINLCMSRSIARISLIKPRIGSNSMNRMAPMRMKSTISLLQKIEET